VSFIILCVAGFAGACGGEAASSLGAPSPGDEGGTRVALEESDLYRRDGSLLYIQNPDTGLNIVDVSDPRSPRRLGRASVRGTSGELYVHAGFAIVLLKSKSSCAVLAGLEAPPWPTNAELQIVDVRDPSRPTVRRNVCVPGQLVASRLVGEHLVLVTTHPYRSVDDATAYVFSLAVDRPDYPVVIDAAPLQGASKEILVTQRRIYVAGFAPLDRSQTRVALIDIDALSGKLTKRGEALVRGEPQGRFHMDERGDTFRIVTFEASLVRSRLTVLNVADPDRPAILGTLGGLGIGERLFATRFEEDKAYIVTFRQTDPLWIVSLENPAQPALLGELIVPGYSDFIFPRGDRLLAVGRPRLNMGVQVSLFDVSNPRAPRTLTQLTLGGYDAQSEANRDHRAVTVLEPGEDIPGANPIVVLPYTTGLGGGVSGASPDGCGSHRVAFLEMSPARLTFVAEAPQLSLVRRTFAMGGVLLSIGDFLVSAFDVFDPASPIPQGEAIVGTARSITCRTAYEPATTTPSVTDTTQATPMPIDRVSARRMLCQSTHGAPLVAPLVFVGLALVVLRARRRRPLASARANGKTIV
jgi:hypothetical protein